MDMDPVPGYALASWETGYGDFGLQPDLETLRRIPVARGNGDRALRRPVARRPPSTPAIAYVDDRYGRTNPVAIGEVVVRMQLGVQGDCTLDGVAYQVHLLLHKATPSFRTIHPDPQGGVVVGEG